VLDVRINDRDLQVALEHLSTFYVPGSSDLRGQVEQRNVVINQSLLALFGRVQKVTERCKSCIGNRHVMQSVGAMRGACEQLDARLQHTKELSGKLIQQTDALAKQHKTLQAQRTIATQFLDRFQLTDAELDALKASELRPAFFDALARVGRVHADCKLLLRTQHQRAGLEIMDAMAS
jgi:hypothetical protein